MGGVQGRRANLSNLVFMIDESRWMVGGCIAFVLRLLGFLKKPPFSIEIGTPSFSFKSLCVHGIVVFLFSCKFHLAAYTGSKYYSLGEC
jgi:hypothetical protein